MNNIQIILSERGKELALVIILIDIFFYNLIQNYLTWHKATHMYIYYSISFDTSTNLPNHVVKKVLYA